MLGNREGGRLGSGDHLVRGKVINFMATINRAQANSIKGAGLLGVSWSGFVVMGLNALAKVALAMTLIVQSLIQ